MPSIISGEAWKKIHRSPEGLENMIIINTNYDPSLPQNSKFPGPKGDREKIFKFTQIERSKASMRTSVTCVDQLKSKVCVLFF